MPRKHEVSATNCLAILLAVTVSGCSGSDPGIEGFGGSTSAATGGTSSGGTDATRSGGSSTGDNTSSSNGGASNGGVATGGKAAGGVSNGGASNGGIATGGNAAGGASNGGASNGGASNGGASNGGASNGGASNGGKAAGGASSGGASNGGIATGGKAAGGASSGGASNGGEVTGGRSAGAGAANGGTATGGTVTGGAATGGAATGGASNGCTATGFHVKGSKVYDSKCNEFIMRGVNYPYAWFTTSTSSRFADIASVKGNTVRIVISVSRWTRTSGSTIASLISWAKANKLIAMLEVHDCTGYGDDSAALAPDSCVDYWLTSDISSALKGNEAYAMINIANEMFGNETTSQWASFYQTAIPKFRNAGLRHTLVVDAPNWAQDWSNTMRDGTGATGIFNADPDKNVVFSVHMYDVYSTASTVTAYFTNFKAKGLPLIVGEFAADHADRGDVSEDTIFSQCQQDGLGYLGWSWSGNSSDLSSLDITNDFNVGSLTTWGNRLVNGTNGLKATAQICSVFL